ncbi:AIG2-like protein [Artemisia annua]|uniref:Gamma-glutamylcyclotransferase family protein n=1 Tax=Artemisia annua TaxID=35608 RepID=A0A2U1L3U7_ARTAN|nr:AIG2-like protein [Artemisia annua]
MVRTTYYNVVLDLFIPKFHGTTSDTIRYDTSNNDYTYEIVARKKNHSKKVVFRFANHPLLQSLISQNDAVFIGTYTTDLPFPLVQGPYGVPFLLNFPGSGQHRVRGELYSVSDHGLEKLDDLEGITLGHYERLPVKVVAENGGVPATVEAMAYYGHRSFAEDMWRKVGEVGFGEYSHELEKCYVKRDLRPKDTSFRDHIRLFCSS